MTFSLIALGVGIVGCSVAYAMFRLARKRKVKIQELQNKVNSLSLNLQMLREAEVTDARSQTAIERINQKIKEAETDEDAEDIRRDFVDSVLGGLRDMRAGLPSD